MAGLLGAVTANPMMARQFATARQNMTAPTSVMDERYPAWKKSQDQATQFLLAADLIGSAVPAGLLAAPAMKKGLLSMGETVAPKIEDYMANTGLLQYASHAKAGGEVAQSNGYFYKGGQFLPTTAAEPGRWKVDGKWVSTGKQQVGPNDWQVQPTPFSRSIYELIGSYAQKNPDGKLVLREGIKDAIGAPVHAASEVRPGVKGVLGKESLTMQEFIDAYNSGQRWFDVKPLSETITTK